MAGREDVNSYMEKTDKMVNHTRYQSEFAVDAEVKSKYPFIDRGQLALVRGRKHSEVKAKNEYIESAANQMIKHAGKQYEEFITVQMRLAPMRDLCLKRRQQEKRVAKLRIAEKL